MLPLKLEERLTKKQAKICVAGYFITLIIIAAFCAWSILHPTEPAQGPVITQERVTQLEERLGKVERAQQEVSRGAQRGRSVTYEATAFDLSIQCCGKPLGHPGRGLTKGGYDLNGMTREEAMTIACNSLPMGTRVRLTFTGSRAKYSGIYTVRDTGGMGPGVIDLYLGDFGEEVGPETEAFGRPEVEVEVL